MKKLTLLFYILLVLYTTPINALLTLEPSSIDTNSFLNQEKKIEITLTNTHNFTIYNINFSTNNYITYPFISELEINQSVKKNITILTTTTFSQTSFSSTIKFYYMSYIDLPATTYNVTITDSEFTPQTLTIKKGDSIKWINNGSLDHTLTSSLWNYNVLSGGEKTITFNDETYIDYHDTNIGFHGYITIINQSEELTHNSNYDKTLTINLESKHLSTTIEGELISKDFSVKYNNEDEALIKIKNIGSKEAVDIKLTSDSDWITFNENNFNLSEGETNFIIYNIAPFITSASESNKTYTIEIKAEPTNANTFTDIISVFVPFEQAFVEINESQIEDCLIENSECWIKRKKLCDAYPYSKWCNPEPKIVEKEVIKYKDSEIPVNYTDKDVFAMKTDIATIKQDNTKTNKFLTEEITNIKNSLADLFKIAEKAEKTSDEALAISLDNKQRNDNRTVITLISVIIAVIILGSGAITYLLMRIKKKQNLADLHYPQTT